MILVGKHYRLNHNLYSDDFASTSKGAICRVIGNAVYTDTIPHEECTTLEFENGILVRTYFGDEYLELVEDCNG